MAQLTDSEFKVNLGVTMVRKRVEDELRRAIVDGHFAPGQHLSDRSLTDMFNVSRAVVREAVRQLEAEGLVMTIPHRGPFVKGVSVEEARQIYDVRCVLEALAAKDFCRNATDQQIEELAGVVEQIRAMIDAPRGIDLLKLKQQFYAIVLKGGGNVHVEQMLGLLLNRNTQLRRTSLSAPNRLPQTVSELEAIVEAFRRREEDAACAASVLHVRNAARVAIDILAHAQSPVDTPPEKQ